MTWDSDRQSSDPCVRMARVRRTSTAVSLVVSWLCVMKFGQDFSSKATQAFIAQEQYILIDASEDFTLKILLILPVVTLSTYWLTRLLIAAPQFISRYMASRRNVQRT